MNWLIYACLAVGLASAMVAGVFQAFSDFVMRGLILADPAGGIESMQHINRTVFRSAFMATFLALVPITVGFAAYGGFRLGGPSQVLLAVAAATYVITVFGVTVVGNVPMNEHLDTLAYRSAEAAAYWSTYGRVWTWWNHVRTVGALVTAACFLLAAVDLARS